MTLNKSVRVSVYVPGSIIKSIKLQAIEEGKSNKEMYSIILALGIESMCELEMPDDCSDRRLVTISMNSEQNKMLRSYTVENDYVRNSHTEEITGLSRLIVQLLYIGLKKYMSREDKK